MPRIMQMSRNDVRQRAGAAREFLQVAQERLELVRDSVSESAEAQVAASNAISAGIAVADAICGSRLSTRANDGDHRSAVTMLATVSPDGKRLSVRLARLLADKSQLQYGGYCTAAVARAMTREAEKLIEAMEALGIRA